MKLSISSRKTAQAIPRPRAPHPGEGASSGLCRPGLPTTPAHLCPGSSLRAIVPPGKPDTGAQSAGDLHVSERIRGLKLLCLRAASPPQTCLTPWPSLSTSWPPLGGPLVRERASQGSGGLAARPGQAGAPQLVASSRWPQGGTCQVPRRPPPAQRPQAPPTLTLGPSQQLPRRHPGQTTPHRCHMPGQAASHRPHRRPTAPRLTYAQCPLHHSAA